MPAATATTLQWSPTGAPSAARYDDICFRDASTGWTVNSDGRILKTTDGGATWAQKFQVPLSPAGRPIWLRCVAFANDHVGWVGTVSLQQRLYNTSDAGENWTPVGGLPPVAPVKICGLCAVDGAVIYGSGSNDPSDGAAMIKSVDGGASWTAWDMSAHASNLIDVYFSTPDRGWVVGGVSNDPNPKYGDVLPVILHTRDGGKNWEDCLKPLSSSFPKGTWGWKIQFLDDLLGFVSLENLTQAFILRTTDGGTTWEKFGVTNNANIEGIGFLNAGEGWVGGWGDEDFASGKTSATTDGGLTWNNADHIGKFINRFRFLGSPVTVGYAGGNTIYKYSALSQPLPATEIARAIYFGDTAPASFSASEVPIEFTLPAGTRTAAIHIWNRFGKEIRTLLDETNSSHGSRTVYWDRRDDDREVVRNGIYVYRLTLDGDADAESRVITLR